MTPKNISKTNFYYLVNFSLVMVVLFTISSMFFIQFKVDDLQDRVGEVDAQINASNDEIRVLEVEWVYLTRPERLRTLSAKYLQNNSYTNSNQIKDTASLEKYYTANLARQQSKSVAMNNNKNVNNIN